MILGTLMFYVSSTNIGYNFDGIFLKITNPDGVEYDSGKGESEGFVTGDISINWKQNDATGTISVSMHFISS